MYFVKIESMHENGNFEGAIHMDNGRVATTTRYDNADEFVAAMNAVQSLVFDNNEEELETEQCDCEAEA